jgi:hypothetical protein
MEPKPEEMHEGGSRYVPANRKDHERPIVKHNYVDHENEGMDTHTHTSRYVPAGQKPFLFGLFGKKKEQS